MVIYVVEVGVLLTKEDEEYDSYCVYDKQFGYYDEGLTGYLKYEDAKKTALEYCKNGVIGTYAIILKDDDFPDVENQEELYETVIEFDNTREVIYNVYNYFKGNNGNMLYENFMKL